LFDERIAYKPFEYPDYYTEGWLKQAQAFWLHTEIPMQGDIKDWKEKLNDKEKNLVGNILLGFAQTECAVSDYWTQKVVSWFPKHENSKCRVQANPFSKSTKDSKRLANTNRIGAAITNQIVKPSSSRWLV
jgi:ribonucleotide reductase beta subunit family protein with ferritin-like domain